MQQINDVYDDDNTNTTPAKRPLFQVNLGKPVPER